MAITIGGVLCQELVEGQMEEFDILQGPGQTKGYLCNWTDRFTVAKGLLGLSSTTSIGGLINLLTPMQYPEMATSYVHHVSMKGVGPPTQGPIQFAFQQVKIMATYGCLPWSFAGVSANDFNNQIDPEHPYIWAEQNLSFGVEFITIPKSQVFYKSSGKKCDQDFGFRSPLVNATISLKFVPYIPAPAVLAATIAPVNSVTYLGVAAGYLMFNGVETHQARMSDGSMTQTADYSFSYRPIAPWDYAYNGSIPGWDQIVNSAGANIVQRSDISTVIPTFYNM